MITTPTPDHAPTLTIGPDFLRAGRAVFTVQNPAGEHYTFKITSPPDDHDRMGWQFFFVSLLTGPDNESDYTYLACYYSVPGKVRLTAKSKFNEDSKPFRVLRWAVAVLHGRQPLPAGYQIRHEGKCGRCGRALTTPDSLTSGLGPECRKLVGRS